MSACRTVVVGTDGSDSSLRAVDRAAAIAGDAGARLILACAYYPATDREVQRASEALRDEACQVVGSAPRRTSCRPPTTARWRPGPATSSRSP